MKNEHPPVNGKKSILLDSLIACTLSLCAIMAIDHFNLLSYIKGNTNTVAQQEVAQESVCKFGFDVSGYFFNDYELKANQFLGDILYYEGINYETISELEEKSKDVFSVRKLKAGKNLTFVRPDSCAAPCGFIYQPDAYGYVLYDFQDSVQVKYIEKDVVSIVETASGEVESSLWNAMIDNDLEPAVIDMMEDALSATVDFYHAQKGDRFKLVFERNYIDGESIGVGKLLGAYYNNDNGDHYSVRYKSEDYEGYFDLDGKATKRAFLRAPVKFSRISSRFNRNRLHPVKKRRIPHLGTDYAAPYGTPIQAVANGVVEIVGYGRGNGKYVKIRHNKTYKTQYLHMQKFAKGMKKGVRVSQGQVIGYVGSTGLATGPHVCFRFWKNGKQVDHLRENFPPAKPMKESEKPAYFEKRDEMKAMLDAIPFKNSTNIPLVFNEDEAQS